MANPLTQDKPPRSYNDNVFINCPFDKQYGPIFRAIVFAVYDSRFTPRCALEEMDTGQTRLTKILELLVECKYGIHDISRTELGRSNLPRFNMPFECGLYWGCRQFGEQWRKNKRILVLDSEAHRYHASLSDISGQDIKAHGNDPKLAIDYVRTFLSDNSRRHDIPGGSAIWKRYLLFQEELPKMLRQAQVTRAEIKKPEYYRVYAKFIEKWLEIREAKARRKKRPVKRPTRQA